MQAGSQLVVTQDMQDTRGSRKLQLKLLHLNRTLSQGERERDTDGAKIAAVCFFQLLSLLCVCVCGAGAGAVIVAATHKLSPHNGKVIEVIKFYTDI